MTEYEIYDSSSVELTSAVEVDFSETFENKADEAEIEFLDEAEVDGLSNNEEVTIDRVADGQTVFRGRVIDKDLDDKAVKTVRLKQKYTDLLDFEVDGRIFYYEDSGTVINDLITEEIESRGTEIAEDCSSLSNISSTAPEFELCDFRELPVERWGTDMVFIGFPSDNTTDTEYTIDFTGITFSGDQFHSLQIRNIVNNISGIFSIKVNYVDTNGKNYVWDLGEPDGVNNHVLQAEDASNEELPNNLDTSTDQGNLRLIISLNGQLVESRAIAIDAILTTSVDITSRNHGFSTVNIPTSGREIKRQFHNSVSEAVYNILQEENKKLIVENDDTVTIKERGSSETPLEITSDTNMTKFDVQTDTDKIKNRIVVQGQGDISATRRSNSSISFFGFTKTLKVRDRSIIDQSDADDKAQSLLNKHAFRDTDIIIEIPDTSDVQSTSVGDQIYINYDGIDDYFVVSKISKQTGGLVEITVEAESRNT